MIFDTVASRVYGGGIKRGKDCRVVWHEGRLYIVRSPTDVLVYETSAPVKGGGTFNAQLADGSDKVSFMVPSCGSCRRRLETSAIGQMDRQAILQFGVVDV